MPCAVLAEDGQVDGVGECAGSGVGGVEAVSGVVAGGYAGGVAWVGERCGEVGDRPFALAGDGAVHGLADVIVAVGADGVDAGREDRGEGAEDRPDALLGGPACEAEQGVADCPGCRLRAAERSRKDCGWARNGGVSAGSASALA